MGNPSGDCSQIMTISLTKSVSKFNLLLTGSESKTCQTPNSTSAQLCKLQIQSNYTDSVI